MRYHALVPLAAALANLIICIPVLRRGLQQPITRAFIGMTLAIIAWNLDLFCLYYFTDRSTAEWTSRIFRTGFCFAPVTALHFALTVTDRSARMWRGVLIGGYVAAGMLAIGSLHGELVHDLREHVWGWYPVPGPLYMGFTALVVVFLLLTVERGWHAYRRPGSPRQRLQAKFWLLAAVVQTPFGLANLLPVYGVEVYPVGSLGNVFYVAIVAYGIVRHRVIDLDYVVRKVISFSLAVATVLAPGGFAIFALTRALGSENGLLLTCAALALALAAVILIPMLQEALETQVHRALFPSLYDYRLRLRQLGAALVHVLERGQLIQRLGDDLSDILDVESCHILVRDEQTRRLTPVYGRPGASEALPEELLPALESLSGPVLAAELEGPVVELFRARGWEAAIPLRIQERLTGFVALGKNRDFRIFSAEDLDLLAQVAAGASVALENVSLSRQLRRSEIVLERANQLSSLGMLAAGIAHEIRNPLVAVKTFLDLLPTRLDDADFIDRFRELSLSEMRRVTDLINDLLALGKSKTPDRRMIDIAPALEPVVRLMDTTARKRQVTLEASFAPALPAVLADADQLKQITLNLLLNAIDSSPSGGKIHLDVRHGPHAVVVEVRDQGAGIPADQLETIFVPFYTTKETGTGLGLALVHQMVVEHGGEITVDSAVGKGTVFRVTLPVAQLDLARTGT